MIKFEKFISNRIKKYIKPLVEERSAPHKAFGIGEIFDLMTQSFSPIELRDTASACRLFSAQVYGSSRWQRLAGHASQITPAMVYTVDKMPSPDYHLGTSHERKIYEPPEIFEKNP